MAGGRIVSRGTLARKRRFALRTETRVEEAPFASPGCLLSTFRGKIMPEDLSGQGSGAVRARASLKKYHESDFRITGGRKAHEPGVRRSAAVESCGRAGLAGHADSRNGRGLTGPGLDTLHKAADQCVDR